MPQFVFRPWHNMHQVGFGWKWEVFSMNKIHTEQPFPCDYIRNGYCKRIITSMAESIIYIYNSLNTLSSGKSYLVAPGVAVPPWPTETLLSPLVGGWWGQGIARAFTHCMMKDIYIYIYIYILNIYELLVGNIFKWTRTCLLAHS